MTIDMSGPTYARFQKVEAEARAAQQKGNRLEAARLYRQCAALMRDYAKYGASKAVRQQRKDRADGFEELAAKLEAPPPPAPAAAGEAPGADDYDETIEALIHRSSITWDDIGGLGETKREIVAAYALAGARRPKGLKVGPARQILLYGPPGTGKTLLAAAASNELDATFFNVKVSDMLSKWFGESSRLVTSLFRMAEQRAPAVVFLDEFDALTPPRGGAESGAERRILSTLLSELDGLGKKGESAPYVLTIGATNVPWLIDNAILSRFGGKLVYVPLPDDAARKQILEIQIDRAGHKTAVPIEDLVQRTEGYSGREIASACSEAISRMLVRANPTLLDVADRGKAALQEYELKVKPVSQEEWDAALERVQPSVRQADLDRLSDWRAAQI